MSGSQRRYRLDEALGNPADWTLSWRLTDDVTFCSTCEFCGQGHLRLTHEVCSGTDSRWVCQRCVSRYAFGGKMADSMLDPPEARRHLFSLAARLKQRTCQDIIRQVHAAIDDLALSEVVVYFGRNLQLSPRHAACLFSAMAQAGLDADIRIFEVQTRSREHQAEFGALDRPDRARVWPALSAQQQNRLNSLGFSPFRTARPVGPAGRPGEVRVDHGVPAPG